MLNDEKQSPAIHPAVPAKLAHFTPNAKPGLDWEGSSLNLIDHAAELIRASEQRASLRLTSGGRTSTPRRCASRTRLAGG